ncbi:MAG TPA: hypothetical protein VF952_18240 [Chloroflexia bacterium]|jgi:hypothetical protein
MTTRFSNKEKLYLYRFSTLFLVRCPRCDRQARVVLRDEYTQGPQTSPQWYADLLFGARRLVCTYCGYLAEWHHRKLKVEGACDWYFRQPLWLQTPCCGEVLWALNEEHLDFLEAFVGAGIRESYGNETLASRLPEWMKRGHSREEVLRCIKKLRDTL